ncbi:MAG: hypothetical protein PHE79_04770 [Eubacteriales bacterium]|nr:hypothetical protein [Eubacteriales bacterium]
MLKGHDVKIEQCNECKVRILIDGKELEGVQEVSYEIGVDRLPLVRVEFRPATLNIDKEVAE